MIDELLPFCYGELNLKPWEIEKLTIADIVDMMEGWQRRYERLEDLFIIWSAYPAYQVASPKKCVPLKKFFAHRKKQGNKKAEYEDIMKEFDL